MGFEGAKAVMDTTGDWPVYPGHPLTVAWEIMAVFRNPSEALQTVLTGGLNCAAAVADQRISGGGGEVFRGCELLRRAQKGGAAEDLIAWADKTWIDGGAGGHAKAIQTGLDQAEKIKPFFARKLTEWLSCETVTT